MNYQLPPDYKQGAVWEERYQAAVNNAFKNVPAKPILVKPRLRFRGWAWRNYVSR